MPLLWLSLAFLAGIIVADNVALPTTTWLILTGIVFGILLVGLIIQRIRTRYSYEQRSPPSLANLLPLFLLLFVVGGFRFQASLPDLKDPNFIASHNDTGERISITGVVDSFPDLRDNTLYLRIQTEDIRPYGTTTQHQPVYGTLLVQLDPGRFFKYGDRILLHGYLETPPEEENFSYRTYLARQGVFSLMKNGRGILIENNQGNLFWTVIYSIKTKAIQIVYQLWPDPEASLLAGILLGVETGIPEPLAQAFRKTGTTHIIAISGFNMTIVAGLFMVIFGRFFGPRKGALAAVLGLSLYTLFVGADPAVVRSAIMGGFALFAREVGRRQQALNTMTITAALMALVSPQVLWDVGFQLSFAATLGLVLLAKPMQDGFARLLSRRISQARAEKMAIPVGEYLLFTIAAQITTFPILVFHFGFASWMALIANPAILPAQPPIMTIGGLALILGMVWLPLGKLTAPLVWPFVAYTIRVVEFFGDLSGGTLIFGKISLFWVVLFYGLLFGMIFGWDKIRPWLNATRENRAQRIAIPLIALLGVLSVVVWRLVFTSADGNLHMTVLNVGSGDAILVQSPGGGSVLINGGPSASLLSDGLGRRLPPFKRELDWLVVAAPREAEISGLPSVLERFMPENALWAGLPSSDREADHLREILTNLNVQIVLALPDQVLDLGDGAVLKVLTVSNRGAILLLEWDQFRALLPVGADPDSQEKLRMGKDVGQISVLLMADQGYAPLNSSEWVRNLHPQLVLLSVAADDQNGRPDLETMNTFENYSLLRTDLNGWIRISTDGQQMWVDVEK